MNKNDKRISSYIDQLNEEKMPKEHRIDIGSDEFSQLTDTIRRVKSLKDPQMPSIDFEKRLIESLQENKKREDEQLLNSVGQTRRSKIFKRSVIGITTVAAAAAILFAIPNISLPGSHTSIAYAMEQALKEVKAYHGTIEVIESNQAGDKMLQSKREVWADQNGNYYIKDLEGYSKGMVTVNNTHKEWQLRPDEQKVYEFPAFPDPYRFTFEIGSEVEDVKNALSIKEVGEEVISGRNTKVLEITPKGGATYRLWIDQETELPLQRESAMQNALQYKVSYTQIEFVDSIPTELLTYTVPDGYDIVDTNPEQMVSTIEEAEEMVHITPLLPKNLPDDYSLKGIAVLTQNNSIKLYYGTSNSTQTIVLLEGKANGELKPAADAILGTVSGNPAEILNSYEGINGVSSIRWQESGMEYTLYGNVSMDQITPMVKILANGEVELPSTDEVNVGKPMIEVPVDMEVEENEQKSVDAGHSPWKLDPVFVTQVFSSLLISPEGIVGDYPISYDSITITANDGKDAVAKINSDNTIAQYVYLKRLIRQDDTGIWTVVGYDPVIK